MAEETRLVGDDVSRIRADIESTRAQMSDTLSQIQERLNPERLKAQAKETVREATIGRVKQMARNAQDRSIEASRGMVDVMRDNPLPLALIGIGAGWLLMNSRRRTHIDYHNDRLLTERTPIGYESGYSYDTTNRAPNYQTRPGYDNSYGSAPTDDGVVNRARETVSGAVDSAREHVSHVGDRAAELGSTVRDRASSAGESVRSAAGNVAHRLGDVATGIGARVSDVAGSVSDRSRHAATRANYQYQETPWLGAAVALGLGVAAGLAIPGSERENQLMGDKRNELVGRAREMGREKIDAVRSVASDVIADAKETLVAAKDSMRESVREHAREEGLVSDQGSSSATSSSAGSSYSGGSPIS